MRVLKLYAEREPTESIEHKNEKRCEKTSKGKSIAAVLSTDLKGRRRTL